MNGNAEHKGRRRVRGFLRATLVGGIVFLVPIVILAGIIGKALEFSHKLMIGLTKTIPAAAVGGIPLPRILAVVAIVLVCFIAGLLAKTAPARKMVEWLEAAILSNIPGYTFMKSMGETMIGVEGIKKHDVVLARIEDAWQIAFLVERMEQGQVAVFVPGAPSPLSGSVYFMTEDRIKPLDVPLAAALKCIKGLGQGSGELTRGRL
jgi:uncharacterized membrane protein